MITASEPFEFVPHGRTVLDKHSGKIYNKGHNNTWSENSLLYKLTNFDINDDSIIVNNSSQKETWIIREVFCGRDDCPDDSTQSDGKSECVSDFVSGPPSRMKNDYNISIKSEINSKKDRPGSSRGGSTNSSSNLSKKFNLNCPHCTKKSNYSPLKTKCCYEEELYVKGCTAVLSKGLISTPGSRILSPESRKTIACYTLENPIKHAAFCNFHVNIDNTMLIDALNTQIGDQIKHIKIEDTTEHIDKKIMPSILLIDNKCMRVYATDGREYVTGIPFSVRKVWPMKYGVILEKEGANVLHQSLLKTSLTKLNESKSRSLSRSRSMFNMSTRSKTDFMSTTEASVALPTCFSMSHPLDEVTPVLMKSPSNGCQYYSDTDQQILFVSSDPSIVLIYDWKFSSHSLWMVRKAQRGECLGACPNANMTLTTLSQSVSDFPATLINSQVKNNSTANVSKSFAHSKKGTATPTKNQSKASLANVLKEQGMSPNTSAYAFRHGLSSFAKHSRSMAGNKTLGQAPPTLPLYPDVCFEHMWTDSQTGKRDPDDDDARVFLHTDLVGHNYLCFIARQGNASKLQMVRLQRSHTHSAGPKTRIIVGSVSYLAAKDAVPLEHLKMIALIDETGNIVLHSGTSIVGKVHVGGVLARLIDSPYARSSIQSPFPRRSSLLPSRVHDPDVLDDSAFHLLSPVPHSSHRKDKKSGLQGLCDPAGNCITLKFDKNTMYRITLPELASSNLVTRCCDSLRVSLPRDVSLQLLVKWYGIRNAPGSQDLDPEEEWSMFVNMLYTLMGYNLEKLFVPKNTDDHCEAAEVVTKKQRTSSDGTEDDWDYLLNSRMHKSIGESIAFILNLEPLETCSKNQSPIRKGLTEEKSIQFNSEAILLPYCMQILYAFHLLYEDMKLNTLLLDDMQPLSKFLYQLSKDMRLESYMLHYWTDLPDHHDFEYDASDSQMSDTHLKKVIQPSYFSAKPPSVFAYLNSMWREEDVGTYPYLADTNDFSRNVVEVLSIVGVGRGAGVHKISGRECIIASTPRVRVTDPTVDKESPPCRAVRLLCERGVTLRNIDNLPPAIALYFLMLFIKCRASPPLVWPRECYEMIMREDLAVQTAIVQGRPDLTDQLTLEVIEKENAFSLRTVDKNDNMFLKLDDKEYEVYIGMEHLDTKLLRLMYSEDHRLLEIVNSFQCSVAVDIPVVQMAEVSDHDFAEEQQKHVLAYATRTMCLPMARGMLTLRTLPCVPTEPILLPRLVVSGRGPKPRYMHIELNSSAGGEPAHCLAWPSFHNGCSAGLAVVTPPGKNVRASWIVYNKLKGATDLTNEYAGFHLGLGLNGHLKNMPFINIYELLLGGQEMVSVGLLLGLAATYRGTMNIQALKVMSIHLEALLPPTSIELDIQQNVMDAALLGVGLIYQGSRHTHYTHVLLGEIGKPPGPEMENCIERQGYALAAGLSLGFVLVGAGAEAPPYIAQTLRNYMLGGDKQPLSNKYKDKYKQASFAIREGNIVNLDVTAPGATLALGLIYLNTGNKVVTNWLEPPETSYMLDFVRPDLLMLRCIAKGLINWSDIRPEPEWVDEQIPETIRPYCFVKPLDDVLDYEAMNQTYCNIVAGSCFSLGLRFAGSGDEDAKDAILHYIKLFISLSGKSLGELSGRSTIETCMCVCLLAAGMVMAGRGDMTLLRICRRLRSRLAVPATSPKRPPLTHGGQMAVHLTMGLLFLGGGRMTLSTSPTSIAALVTAFFPKFPVHSEDNRYHLQAFRHLYVLAAEPRLLLPRELNSGHLCYAQVQVVDLRGSVFDMKAPCILPELESLKEVRINDQRYWPVVFHRDRNWDQLKKLLAESNCIDIKPRSGFLSYLEDRHGMSTLLNETLTLEKSNIWSIVPDTLSLFTSDQKTINFIQNYLINAEITRYYKPTACADCLEVFEPKPTAEWDMIPGSPDSYPELDPDLNPGKAEGHICWCRRDWREDVEFMQHLNMVTYECVVKDMTCVLPVWVTFLKITQSLQVDPRSFDIWQIKLLVSQLELHNRQADSAMSVDGQDEDENKVPLMSNELSVAVVQKVEDVLDNYEPSIIPFTRKYLGLQQGNKINTCENQMKKVLSVFVTYYDLPKDLLISFDGFNILSILKEFDGINVGAVDKIQALL